MNKHYVLFFLIALPVLVILNLIVGAKEISISSIFAFLTGQSIDPSAYDILLNLRLPRIIGDILIGAGLAASGLLLQIITKNPLADAGLLGVNASASLGAAFALIFLSSFTFYGVVFLSCLFAAFTLIIIFYIAIYRTKSIDSMQIILTGMIISLFISALATALSIIFHINQSMLHWSLGGTSGIQWKMIFIASPVILIASIVLILIHRPLSLLILSTEYSESLGINTFKLYSIIFILVLSFSGTSVALAGSVSFIGLIAPHLTKSLLRYNMTAIITLTMLTGSCLMLLCDWASRMIAPPFVAPIGAVLSFIGAPLFLYIANRKVVY